MKNLRIHYLQHVPFEGLGYFQTWIDKKQHTLTATRFYEEDNLPPIDSFDWLIIMGGPMGVNDESEYFWLKDEKVFIRKAIGEGKTVIGICLGAQLIVAALGAQVYPNPKKEIGWFPIYLTKSAQNHPLLPGFPDKLTVFHWHNATFELPKGSYHLFESEGCKNQAFIYNDKVLGLQFHIEVTEKLVQEMLSNGQDELKSTSPFVMPSDEIKSYLNICSKINNLMYKILDHLEK